MKTNKSYAKRLKVTKNGKIVARKPGQNHFNAKESGRKQIARGRATAFKMSTRDKRRYLAGSF